jgi:hypothetical protein
MTYKPAPLEGADFQAYVQREFVKIAAEFLALQTPPAPNPDVLWRWEATAISPFFLQAKDPSRAVFTKAGGRNAVRLLTMPGDSNLYGSNDAERCDLRLGNDVSDAKEGREWWFKHSVWFPDDYVDQPQSNGTWNWGSVMNWHDDADSGGSQGPLQMMNMPMTATSQDRAIGLTFQVYGGDPNSQRRGQFFASPISRNVWYDFTYHIKWTSTASGFCDGWLNDKQFMAYKGPTLYTGRGAYLKLTNYHTAHGKPSAMLHGPVVRARTREGLS